jgi:TolB protein
MVLALLAAGGSEAAFPGKNGRIVFVLRGDLWTIAADGTDLKRLTKTIARELGPSWSPDGTRIAYALDTDVIYVANADGSGAVDISTPSVQGGGDYTETCDTDPAWSPNGKLIAFSATVDDCSGAAGGIYAMAPDGSGRTVIEQEYEGLLGGDTQPAWGPGGTRIAITRSDSLRMASGPYVNDLYVVDVRTGRSLRWLTKDNGSSSPSYSPDGKQIVFVNAKHWVTVLGPDRKQTPLVPGVGPAWSPDGMQIAYVDARGLEVMKANGKDKHLLLRCRCSEPDWQRLR